MKQPKWIGQTLSGRYKIEELLGQGGMSAVYKATDPNLRRVVAIKIVHPHLSVDPSFLRRFEEEAAAIAALRHPNIVQVFDFNTDEDVNYMVMEFVPGETLQARLKRLNKNERKMPISEAVQISMNVCEGLSYAHKRGMVHRDVKPANIMLDVNGQAILMDFGIVKIVGSSAHTLTGAVIGTANYMAPEIIRSEPADPRSDIYALGITLFEMLSGRPPFDADSAMTIMMMHLNDPLPDISSMRADIPEALTEILRKMLVKDRNHRYQSAEELAIELRQLSQRLDTKEIPAPIKRTSTEVPQKEETTPTILPDESIGEATTIEPSVLSVEDEVTRIDTSNLLSDQDVTVVEPPNKTFSPDIISATQIDSLKGVKSSKYSKKKSMSIVLGVIILAIIVVTAVIGYSTSWFGLANESSKVEQTQPASQPVGMPDASDTQLTLSALEVMNAARTQSVINTERATINREHEFTVCHLTDMGSVSESTFQETVHQGITNAQQTLGIKTKVLESISEVDYERHLTTFVELQCDLIVSSGFMLGETTIGFAQSHPERNFSIVDYENTIEIPNLISQVYQVDEAAFLAGYLAAGMTESGKVATFGGLPMKPVQTFMDGFRRGVSYYNRVKDANVEVIGWDINNPTGGMFVESFSNQDLGVEIGNELINQNVDVIFPVAGMVGLGTARVMLERNAGYVIGVDYDWANMHPELAPVILTSVVKKSDITTFEIIRQSLEGRFQGGKYIGNLSNQGVELAPYHDLGQVIPEQMKNEILEIREQIIVGDIELSPIYKIK